MAATIYNQLEHAVNIRSVTTSEQWQYTINDNMRSVTIYGQRQYTIIVTDRILTVCSN
jgi:hypothetical protein